MAKGSVDVMAIPVIQTGYYEWVSTAQVSNIPLDQCSGIVAGDLLLLIVGNEDSSATPQFENNVTGFDLQFEIGDGTSDNHLAVYTRIATETEEATTNVPTVTSDYAYGWYLRITGAHPTAFWDGHTSGVLQSAAPIDVTGRDTGATGEEYAQYLMETMQDPNLKERWESFVKG